MDRREIPRSKRGRTDCAVNCTTRSSEEAPWGGSGIREQHQHCATQNSALLFKYITSAISASVSVICVEQLHIYCTKGVHSSLYRNLRFSMHPIKHALNKRQSKLHMCRLYPATTRIPRKLTAEVTTN